MTGIAATHDRKESEDIAALARGGRTNLFGFAVLEVDYVRALESTGGWRWVFAVQPGF